MASRAHLTARSRSARCVTSETRSWAALWSSPWAWGSGSPWRPAPEHSCWCAAWSFTLRSLAPECCQWRDNLEPLYGPASIVCKSELRKEVGVPPGWNSVFAHACTGQWRRDDFQCLCSGLGMRGDQMELRQLLRVTGPQSCGSRLLGSQYEHVMGAVPTERCRADATVAI